MARKKHKGHKMTATQKYQRLKTGLKYFGIELKDLKRATGKALKKAQKIYQEIRKQLKEEGYTDIPNIAQLAKEVIRQEKESETPSIPEPELREPLDYAGDEEVAAIDFSSVVLDDFLTIMEDAMSELAGMYGMIPQIWNTMSEQHSAIIAAFNTLRTEMGDENLASYLENSMEYDALKTITKYSYNEAVEILDNVLSDLTAIMSDAKNQNPQIWIAPTDISLG